MKLTPDWLKYSKMGMWIRATWVVEEDTRYKPTWLGSIVIWILKFIWSVVILLYWVICYYILVFALICIFGLLYLLGSAARGALFAPTGDTPKTSWLDVWNGMILTCQDVWDILTVKPKYWQGRDKPIAKELHLPNDD